MPCTHLKELAADEGPFLEIELRHHQILLETRLGKPVSKRKAEIDYLAKLGKPYLTGFKDCFCAYVCSERETCDILKDRKNNI